MGQYAIYIWGSYGFSAFVLGGLAWQSVRCLIHYRKQLTALDKDMTINNRVNK